MEAIQTEVITLLIAIIAAFIGVVSKHVATFMKKKGVFQQIENNKEIAKIVVNAVEQTYQHLEGKEKLGVAKSNILKILNEKKIKISEKEIDLLIESSLKEIKDSIKEANKK